MKRLQTWGIVPGIMFGYILGLITFPLLLEEVIDFHKVDPERVIYLENLAIEILLTSQNINSLRNVGGRSSKAILDDLISEIDATLAELPSSPRASIINLSRAESRFSESREEITLLEESPNLTESEQAEVLERISRQIRDGVSFLDKI